MVIRCEIHNDWWLNEWVTICKPCWNKMQKEHEDLKEQFFILTGYKYKSKLKKY